MSEISVLVPSYNHAKFVEGTLRSIFAQTRKPKKLIVIDDGSKDESVAVIEKTLSDCPFDCQLIARENRGLCATLNEGFSLAEGEFFAYLGSDDLWLKTFLQDRVELLETRPGAALAFGHAFVIDENDDITDRTDNWTDFPDGDLLPSLLQGEIFSSPTVVYRRSALEKFRWNERSKLEDYEMYLQLATRGEFAKSDAVLSAWRRHGANTSDNFTEMIEEQIAAQERHSDELNIDRAQLKKYRASLLSNAVFELIRTGKRDQAREMLAKARELGLSPRQSAKMLFRLAVPERLFQWNRRRKRRNAVERFGKLNI
ncbi:MAG: glycosyltransferase [Pyrinomonadaceae bacterium]|nr:glycosyltransferase [Pyrinomonadaceae bacterium]